MTKRKEEGVKLSFPVSEERDHIQGLATAAVTLVEYGDYECPFCAQAYLIVREVQERLGRSFPLT
jgi:protein-disulfide isomerase